MAESFKIVIVGSGVAGAILAYKLAGHHSKPKILVLEAGHNGIDDTDDAAAQRDRHRFVSLYALTTDRDSVSPYTRLLSTKTAPHPTGGVDTKHLVQGGPDGFKSNYARLLGGSTWAWRGNCPRMVPADFELKKRYGVGDNWPITYGDLLPDFAEAEKELGIAGNTDEWDEETQGKRGAGYPMPGIAQAFGDIWLKKQLHDAVVDSRKIRVIATPQARVSIENYKHPDTGYARKRCEGKARPCWQQPSDPSSLRHWRYQIGPNPHRNLAQVQAIRDGLRGYSQSTFANRHLPDLRLSSVAAVGQQSTASPARR